MSSKKRKYKEDQFSNKITYYSFVMSIFVVGIHAYNVERYQLEEKVNDCFGHWILLFENNVREWANICVPFFFMISGYLFFRTFEWDTLLDKYKSRIKSIVIPYVTWCTIYYLYYSVITHIDFLYGFLGNIEIVHINIHTWIKWLWSERYYTLWFMQDLIVLIVISPIIYLLLKRWSIVPTGMLVLFIMLFCEMGILPIEYSHINVYYFIGAYIGINYQDGPRIRNNKLAGISLGILLLVGGYVASGRNLNPCMILLSCFGLWEITNFVDYDTAPKWYFKISFFIYCMHDLFLEGLEGLFFVVFGNGSIFALIDYLFMPLVVVGICILVAYVLRNYLGGVWCLLAGGRN